jgi:hypothetical protein
MYRLKLWLLFLFFTHFLLVTQGHEEYKAQVTSQEKVSEEQEEQLQL